MKKPLLVLSIILSLILLNSEIGLSDESVQNPSIVQLLSPQNRALDVVSSNNFLEWLPSSNATTYRLHLTLDEHGIDTVIYEGNLGTTFYILPQLNENTIYYWKVRAENKAGVSDWSELRQFRTAIPDGEALVVTVKGADSLIGYVALNSQTTWNGNFLYSKVKSLSQDGSIIFTEKDFPVLFAQDFMVRRIDFIGLDGKTLIGHLFVNYLFTASYPRTPRKDIIVFFHKNNRIHLENYPFWLYYSKDEIPVTALIPPLGRMQSIRSNSSEPIVLISGLGGNYWGNTTAQLYNNNLDIWEFLYPVPSLIDSNASLLRNSINEVNNLYKKNVGIVAHSSGGLVARAMIQRDDYNQNISKLLLLGTPNFGSFLCYKKVYTDELNTIGNQFIQGLEKYSPLLTQLSPASTFLFKLNSIPPKQLSIYSEVQNTYLSIAGTKPMPLGIFHNEITSEDDGVVSVASASMSKWNIPLATVNMQHSRINVEETSKNLQGNSQELIKGFFSKEYSPTSLPLALELAVDGFWLKWNITVKSDSRFLPGKSILEVSLPDIQENSFTVTANPTLSTITFSRRTLYDNSQSLSLISVPETNNYFAADIFGNKGLEISISTLPQSLRLADWIILKDNKQVLHQRMLPISCVPEIVEVLPLVTTMETITPKFTTMKSWFLGADRRQENQLISINNSDTVYFDVDTYMDTMVIARFLPIDTNSFNQIIPHEISTFQNFRMIAPNGVIIDTSINSKATFLPYSSIGYQNFSSDNVSYYFMNQPQPGKWKIISSKSQNAHFVQSYLSDVHLKIITSDSLYKPKDTVPFQIILPKFYFTKPKLKVYLYSSQGDTIGQESTLHRNDSTQFIYTGYFTPQINGIYRISADFTCNFPAGIIHRSASKTIEIIDVIPTIPLLLYPQNKDSNVALNTLLLWTKDSKANTCQVQFSASRNFSDIIMDTVLFDTSIISLPKLNPFSTYYWRVRANNRRGWSPWSETFLFRTNNINLTAPILKTPQNGKVTIQQNIELAWNQSFRAKFYRLQISVDSLFTSIIGFDSSLAKSDFQFSMKSNTKYFWRVKATGIDKTESNWSEVWNFKRLLPSPTQLLPENKSVNLPLNIKMKWYSPDISLRFHVEISSKADFSEIVFNQTTLGDTILYAALPSNFTTFYWRIRWIYTDGSQSDWSEVWSFTTMLARPRLDSPGDKVTGVNLNPTLTWNSVPGGMYYHLQLAYDSEFKQKIFEDSLLLVIAKPLKSLLPLTNYYWHVRSIISNGSSEWSEIWSFKTGEEVMSVDNEHRIYNSINIAPQPASGLTSIHLNLLEYNKVTVVIIDLLGRIVYEYPQTNFESGKHSFPFQLATEGVYICKVTIGSQIVVQKFVY